MSIQGRLDRIEKLIAKRGQPCPTATVTLKDGVIKTVFWDDALRLVLDGAVLKLDCDNVMAGLLNAMMPHTSP